MNYIVSSMEKRTKRQNKSNNGQDENLFPTQLVVHRLYLVYLARLAHRAIPELVAFQAEDPHFKRPRKPSPGLTGPFALSV
jgi:hypothetical protein